MNSDGGRGIGPIPDRGVSRVGTQYGLHMTVAALVVLLLAFAFFELVM